MARRLAQDGYDLAVHYFHGEEFARSLVEELQRAGRRAVALGGDLTQDGMPQTIVANAVEALGQIDVLVNNAGVTYATPFVELDPEQVEACYRINYWAPLWLSHSAARWMTQNRRAGAIVHITSVHQERVTDRDNIYGAMKAALARLGESLAYELAPYRIRVNCVAPGRIITPERLTAAEKSPFEVQAAGAIALGRSGIAEEVAEAVAWLVSDRAAYVTGVTLRVDGGLNLPMARALIGGELHFI
jgi:NAD(P)-dependent dehydrogenase (short-subunit alcohol dehydrogenase family)